MNEIDTGGKCRRADGMRVRLYLVPGKSPVNELLWRKKNPQIVLLTYTLRSKRTGYFLTRTNQTRLFRISPIFFLQPITTFYDHPSNTDPGYTIHSTSNTCWQINVQHSSESDENGIVSTKIKSVEYLIRLENDLILMKIREKCKQKIVWWNVKCKKFDVIKDILKEKKIQKKNWKYQKCDKIKMFFKNEYM